MIRIIRGEFKNDRGTNLLINKELEENEVLKCRKFIVHFLDVERLNLRNGDIIEGPYHKYIPLYRGIYEGSLFKGLVEKVK